MYTQAWKAALVTAIVCAALMGLLANLTPPSTVSKLLTASPDRYSLIRQARVAFGGNFNEQRDLSQHEISLPVFAIKGLSGYQPADVWMEFQIEREAGEGPKFLFLPKIWGEVVVYVNGLELMSGSNIEPEIELPAGRSTIRIRSDLSNSARESPLTALYPPFVSSYADGKVIRKQIESQMSIRDRATAVFLFAILIFALFLAADPRKVELAFLILYLGVHIVRNEIAVLNDNNIKFVSNWDLQQFLLVVPDYILNFANLLFVLAFIRLPMKKVSRPIAIAFTSSLVLCPMLFILFRQVFADAPLRQPLLISITLHYLLVVVFLVVPQGRGVFENRRIPFYRRISVLLVVGTIVAVYFLNFLDFLSLTQGITTEYRNGLFLVLAICTTVGFEVAVDAGLAQAGRVATQAAHDIRGPLAALRAALGLGRINSPSSLRLVSTAVSRINSIAEELMQVGQSPNLEKEPLPLVRVDRAIEAVILEKQLQYSLRKEVSIVQETGSGTIVYVRIGANVLHRMISNLLDNAVEALNESGGSVRVQILEEDGRVAVSIADNGRGIDPATLQKIGRRGFSTKTRRSQTVAGLGVYGVMQELKRIDGSLCFKSVVNEGTEATLRFPVSRQSDNGQPEVVLIDDDPLIIELWSMAASRKGIAIATFSSRAAFELSAGKFQKDARIYVDANLATEDGIELSKRIAAAGFQNVYLATGDVSLTRKHFPWLKGIVGKEPPWL
jgi:signal transduction histidine kinase